MRPSPFNLCAALPALLSAQPALLDHGRLDPAWFGPGVAFERTTRVYYLWVRPGLTLQGRSLRLGPWEPTAWLVKPRPDKDHAFLNRLEPILIPTLQAGLAAEWKEAVRVSTAAGDLLLTGRVTDCRADGVGAMFGGLAGIYFDLKVTDPATGDLLVAAHHFIEGASAESIQTRYADWCRFFARVLGEQTGTAVEAPPLAPLPLPKAPAPAPAPAPPAVVPVPSPTVELETTLRRLETLRRDGLLTESEFQTLRKQAVEKAQAPR